MHSNTSPYLRGNITYTTILDCALVGVERGQSECLEVLVVDWFFTCLVHSCLPPRTA